MFVHSKKTSNFFIFKVTMSVFTKERADQLQAFNKDVYGKEPRTGARQVLFFLLLLVTPFRPVVCGGELSVSASSS